MASEAVKEWVGAADADGGQGPAGAVTWRIHATTAAMVAGIVAVFVVLLWLAPKPADRFDRCMAIAERAGLLETHRDEAALICLSNATERGGGDGDGPIVVPQPDGRPLVLP